MKDVIAVDLFCGAGGLTRGLLDAGIKVKKGYDIDVSVKETYEKNNDVPFVSIDIKNLKGFDVLQGLNREENFFLLAGCAPCQPFSNINRTNKRKDDRKSLLLDFGRIVKETLPDYIFIENVPGLKSGKGKRIFQNFEKTLDELKYNYKSEVLNVKDYGVPQNRKRLILIGSLHGPIEIPKPTHGPGKNKKYVTVKDSIFNYPSIKAGTYFKNIPNHHARNLSKKNITRLRKIPKDGGSRKQMPSYLRLKCHIKHKGHSDVYGRMKWNSVAPTLTCKCTSISNGRFAHPSENRGISLREAASLQTFRDSYVFYGNMSQCTRWIGNAVPVKFSSVFGNYFSQISKDWGIK